ERDRRLARAAVTDDQLALAATDRDHRVDRLEPGHHRLLHRLPLHDAGRDDVDIAALRRADLALAVDRIAERVHHPAEVALADTDVEHAARAPHRITLVQRRPVAHDDCADVVLLEVQRQRRHRLAGLRRRDLEHLARHRVRQTVDARDAVLHLQDLADFLDLQLLAVLLDLTQQHILDLTRAKLRFSARHVSFSSVIYACASRRLFNPAAAGASYVRRAVPPRSSGCATRPGDAAASRPARDRRTAP